MDRNSRILGGEYREHLRTAVGSSAAPYGYTLATWTTGGVLTHAYGVPATTDALLFMAGAILAFAMLGVVAFGDMNRRFAHAPREAALWGSFHFLSVGGAIGAAAIVGSLVDGRAAGWALGPFASTTTYLLVLGAQFSAADRRNPENQSLATLREGSAGSKFRREPSGLAEST